MRDTTQDMISKRNMFFKPKTYFTENYKRGSIYLDKCIDLVQITYLSTKSIIFLR